MNSDSTRPDGDNDELARLTKLYRGLETPSPSKQLTAAITNAVDQNIKPRKTLRWVSSLALAAGVVLAVALSVFISKEQPKTDDTVSMRTLPNLQSRDLSVGSIYPAPAPETTERQSAQQETTGLPEQCLSPPTGAGPADSGKNYVSTPEGKVVASPYCVLIEIGRLRDMGKNHEAAILLAELKARERR